MFNRVYFALATLFFVLAFLSLGTRAVFANNPNTCYFDSGGAVGGACIDPGNSCNESQGNICGISSDNPACCQCEPTKGPPGACDGG
jgi:hypothetical protein